MKKRKGFTIAEVLVSLTVFGIIFFTCVTTFNGASRAYYREKEYVTFESICTDIDAYCSMYGTNWYNHYFEMPEIPDHVTLHDYSGHCVYYNETFKPYTIDPVRFLKAENEEGDKPDNYKYVLSWRYEKVNAKGLEPDKYFLLIDIYEQLEAGSMRYIVEDLDYGYTRFYYV